VDEVESEIAGAVVEHTGWTPPGGVSASLRIVHDLKLSGDDFDAFVAWMVERFGLDLTGFPIDEYAPDEGRTIWPSFRPFHGPKRYREMTIADAADLARAGAWRACRLAASPGALAWIYPPWSWAGIWNG